MTEKEISVVAWHEAGHHLAAGHFKIPSFPEVAPEGYYAAGSTVALAGICHLDGPVSRWQGCVIGWAGALAQAMAGARFDWMPPFKPTARDLKDWHLMMTARLQNLSEPDQRLIRGCYKMSFLACKCAFRILRKNTARLKRVAGYQADALRVRSTANDLPLPEAFPASLDDFQKLAPASPEQFAGFIVSKAQRHLAGGSVAPFEEVRQSLTLHFERQVDDTLRAAHPGLADTEIAARLFDAELERAAALWRGQFAAGFANRESWTAALREFRTRPL